MDAICNLEKMLGKKTTFEESVKKLAIMMEQEYTYAGQQSRAALYKAVCRAATLLKSRYTAKSFWTLGARLFHVASLVVERPEERTHMEHCLASANEFLGEFDALDPDNDRTLRAAAAPPPFQFEGQLTSGVPPQPQWLINQTALFALAEARERAAAATPSAAPSSRSSEPPPATAQDGNGFPNREPPLSEPTGSGQRGEAEATRTGTGEEEEEAAAAERSGEGGESPSPPGGGGAGEGQGVVRDSLEAVIGELGDEVRNVEQLLSLLQARAAAMDVASEELRRLEEAIQASLADEPITHHARPPAAKAEVQKLATFEVTEEWLAKERGGSETAPRCTICMEDLEKGHTLQQMPCHHYFHPDCLLQWLKDNNSCPLCLFEMPTDDSDYERRKEREREEAEERHGVENALHEAEFMYM